MELNQMRQNTEPNAENEENIGYLVIRASTARGAVPLENAAVNIRGGTPDTSGIVFSLRTNSDGITEKIPLPAPARYLSESAGNSTPYSLWNIDVFKDGYVPIAFQNVPVYSSIVSVQPALMSPIPENFKFTESYNESQAPNL